MYRSGERLRPHLVRVASTVMHRRWRGLDPEEVYAYLHLVAEEMERLAHEAATAKTEAERVRQGLRQWQARHVGCKFADPPDAGTPPPGRKPSASHRRVDGAEQDRQHRNGGHW